MLRERAGNRVRCLIGERRLVRCCAAQRAAQTDCENERRATNGRREGGGGMRNLYHERRAFSEMYGLAM